MNNKDSFLFEIFNRIDRENFILRSDSSYDEERKIYNRMHDVYPLMILRTLCPEDISFVVNKAVEYSIPLAVRSGGHHIGGFSVIDDGLVIDFSTFRKVEYNPTTKMVSVQPGARLGDIDKELEKFNRCIPTGTVSDTGITGLTLGGGIGWLVCSAGLTCDYLENVDLINYKGETIKVSNCNNSKLFSVLKGSGMGAFGVITKLTFRTIELPEIIAGSVIFSEKNASLTLKKLLKFYKNKPSPRITIAPVISMSCECRLSVDLCCTSSDVSDLFSLKRLIGGDWSDVKKRSYTEWQCAFNDMFLPPKRGYWKSVHFDSLNINTDLLSEAIVDAPSDGCTILMEIYNPELLLSFSDESFYPKRNSHIGILLSARWVDSERDDEYISWAKKWNLTLKKSGGDIGYSNYSSLDGGIASGYSNEAIDLISSVGNFYDPKNLFAHGHRSKILKKTFQD